ncbi:hypothetical protein HGRIS_014183 [Hohenbuehelia grisea]|uniref:Transmembrane protein n=1 Tax=Hohenbuehelia grisea TaxID=104357 RepID=A0ABR3JTL0_9AGAR
MPAVLSTYALPAPTFSDVQVIFISIAALSGIIGLLAVLVKGLCIVLERLDARFDADLPHVEHESVLVTRPQRLAPSLLSTLPPHLNAAPSIYPLPLPYYSCLKPISYEISELQCRRPLGLLADIPPLVPVDGLTSRPLSTPSAPTQSDTIGDIVLSYLSQDEGSFAESTRTPLASITEDAATLPTKAHLKTRAPTSIPTSSRTFTRKAGKENKPAGVALVTASHRRSGSLLVAQVVSGLR